MPAYTAEALARAAAPVRLVVAAFLDETAPLPSPLGSDDAPAAPGPGPGSEQGRFASLLLSLAAPPSYAGTVPPEEGFLPSRRYVRRLVRRYASSLDERGVTMEDDALASLLCTLSSSGGGGDDAVPDPMRPCTLTFHVSRPDNLLRIRTFPQHNDVGVSRVWEAGACLAEYVIRHPECTRGRDVLELGAGTGLTGLVAAGVGRARSVHMTDFTAACLTNLAHNVQGNAGWLIRSRVDPGSVTVGELEWGEFARSAPSDDGGGDVFDPDPNGPAGPLGRADVLLAADVVYDRDCIPDLVATVGEFLGRGGRSAVFATTYRNEATFALFERELHARGVDCEYCETGDLPEVFPCYFVQPRSDVRVCRMLRARR